MDARPQLIVGLGNPGPEYERSRHNAGFLVLDLLAQRHGLRFNQRKAHAKLAHGRVGGDEIWLAQPQTYMNLSGRSIQGLTMALGVKPTRILVVYDDLDLPLGTIRLRARGGAGTHNGMRSIVECLGTTDFPRLRVGIGTPEARAHPDFVLSGFAGDELKLFEETCERAAGAVEAVLARGLDTAMNEFNG